ncbi:MAG: hypothetical protein FWC43_06705 [Planctomycetaceae bacterium]|nr:hypothetical protein [Planctomycetaceae bacterium]
MSRIDVYKEWLQIAETNRPLNYYQLLKLKPFEDNSSVIRKQYRQLNSHVRKYASGEFGTESQQLLNELAKAMLCLTDQERKAKYDASLGRKGTETVKRRRSLEDILLLNKIVPEDRMKQIKNYADTLGIDLQHAVLQQKIAQPEIVMLAFAESIGLPFISLDDVGVDEAIAPQINPNTARQHSFVPVMADQGQLILASPSPVNPDVEEELRMLFEMPVRCAICTPAQINDAIAKYYPKDAVQMVAKGGKGGKGGKAGAELTAKTAPKKTKPVAQEEYDEPLGPLEPEAQKVRLQSTLIAFCMSIMMIGVGATLTGYDIKIGLWRLYPAAVLIGAVAAGITWVVLSKRR